MRDYSYVRYLHFTLFAYEWAEMPTFFLGDWRSARPWGCWASRRRRGPWLSVLPTGLKPVTVGTLVVDVDDTVCVVVVDTVFVMVALLV